MGITIATVIGFAGYLGIRSALASGEDAFCYTEVYSPPGMAPQYALFAWRDWRTNRQIGIYPTTEEARKVAESLSCRMGHR